MNKNTYCNFHYNKEVKKCNPMDDVMVKNGLIQKLVKDIIKNINERTKETNKKLQEESKIFFKKYMAIFVTRN